MDSTVLYTEHLVLPFYLLHDLVQMIPIGIGNENLSELVAGYQLDNLLYPRRIQFVENIVQQQQRSGMTASPTQEIELRQFQGNQISLVLSL